MPVSGNEETGVKPVIRKSSDYIAGIPIKKRRFPIISPPSSPPEEPTSFLKKEASLFPDKNDSVHKEQQSSPSQGSTLSYASITSSGFSAATNNLEFDYRRGSADVTNVNVGGGSDNLFRVKTEEGSLPIHSGSLDDMQRKGKFVLADSPAPQLAVVKSQLTLAPKESLASNLGKEFLHSKNKVEMKCKEEIPVISQSTELSLGLKEHLPDLTDLYGDGDGSYRNSDKLEPLSLSLSLSKEKDSRCNSNSNSKDLDACRANWDLNTPMDAWTDSFSDALVSVESINTTDGADVVKKLVYSTGVVGTGVKSEKQTAVESQNRTNVAVSSILASQKFKANDSLLLRLSSSCSQSNQLQKSSSSSSKLNPERVISATNSPRLGGPTRNLNTPNHRTVKPEPFDEGVELHVDVAKPRNTGLLDSVREGKHGVVEQCALGRAKSLSMSTEKLVDPRSIKSEPASVENHATIRPIEGASVQRVKHVIQGEENGSSDMTLHMTAEASCLAGKPSCSTELVGKPSCSTQLTVSGDVMKNLGNLIARAPVEAHQSNDRVSITLGVDSKGVSLRTEDDSVDPASCKLKLTSDHPLDSRGSGDGSARDEEKINLSADMLEDSYGSDYESDGNHALGTAIGAADGKEDDYEDGEVRDSLARTAVEDLICKARDAECVDNDTVDNKRMEFVGPRNDVHSTTFYIEAKDQKTENLAETSNIDYREPSEVVLTDKSDMGTDRGVCLQEPFAVEKLASEAGVKESLSVVTMEPLDEQSWMKENLKHQDAELSSDQGANGSQGAVAAVAFSAEVDVDKSDLALMSDSTLSKTSGCGDNAGKDTSTGGQRSRIITLPRSSTVSPSKSLSISGLSLPSRGGQEILPDVTTEEDTINPPGRVEPYVDTAHRFSRERYQDQSLRYSRLGRRGRGRMNSRGDWGSDRNFASELYNNQTNYRVPRYKYAPDVSNGDLEYNTYNMASDGAFVGTGRGGRRLSNDGPINYRMPSRRRSPVGAHAIHMSRRNPSDISPTRCIGEDSSNLGGMRHTEKFMRGFPNDSADPMFTRTQPSHEGGDGQFGRGKRSFSFVQRRGAPRARSKSPIRSSTRSPGQWSSPRRRSPDGFGGPGELTHRRSSPIYRMERFRSPPDESCFPGEMVVRRNPSNDLRDMESGRDHGPPRSVISNRSPSGRILARNRRFDVIDTRERTNNDDYFGRMPSGRLHELSGDGNGAERRRFGERRGPVRSFRPPYNVSDGETFHLNGEDGPRPFRFCPDDDTEFQERGSLRERDFDRRIKNRPGNAPRRVRGIEDQEPNFRHGGQAWHDDGADDMPRAKRKRF